MAETFWAVMVDGGNVVGRQHRTKSAARDEAELLCGKHKRPVCLLKAMELCRPGVEPPPPPQWELLNAPR